MIYVGHEGNKAWRKKREGQGCGQSITQTKLVSLPYHEEHTLGGKAWLMEVSVVCCRRCRHARNQQICSMGL